jgi:hypothetical protein
MNIKEFHLPKMYLQPVEGSTHWYLGMHFPEEICELYEAEEMVKQGKAFVGNQPYWIHYPEGTVYAPFQKQQNVYYETPVWDNDQFGILCVDFNTETILLYTYVPGEEPQILHTLPLSAVEDCYNLKLEMSPWILGRQTNDSYQAIWPIQKSYPLGDSESMICRDGDVLYLSRWEEDPWYQEFTITVDLATGKVLEEREGSLYLMPDGSLWNV